MASKEGIRLSARSIEIQQKQRQELQQLQQMALALKFEMVDLIRFLILSSGQFNPA